MNGTDPSVFWGFQLGTLMIWDLQEVGQPGLKFTFSSAEGRTMELMTV